MTPVQIVTEIITVAAVLLWFALQAVLQHRKTSPVAGGASTGPESPVIANMAVNRWEPTQDAIPATVLDLLHQGVLKRKGPELHLPEVVPDGLRSHEESLVRHLRLIAEDRVVRIDDVDPRAKDFQDFFQDFCLQAHAQAGNHGWTVKRFTGGEKTALVLASLAPAVLALWAVPWPTRQDFFLGGWLVFGLVWYWLGAYALRGPSVRPTVAGAEVTARWQGHSFDAGLTTAVPADITALGRELAYAAAVGKAEVALWLLPWGVDRPESAWTRRSGTWRRLKIWYPWMLGWGYSPRRRFGHVLWKAGVASVVLFVDDLTTFADAPFAAGRVWLTGVPITFVTVLYALAVLDLGLAITELATRRTHVGWVLHRRPAGAEHIYIALEQDGLSRIKAFKLPPPGVDLQRDTKIQLIAGRGVGWVTDLEVLSS